MRMRSELVNPFLIAAHDVLTSELGNSPQRGALRLESTPSTTDEVTAIVGVTGNVEGNVIYSMSKETACGIASRMMGEAWPEFDPLVESAIGELGNVITGRASMLLSDAGYPAQISPPMLIVGLGSSVSTLDTPRLIIPLQTDVGSVQVQVALRGDSVSEDRHG